MKRCLTLFSSLFIAAPTFAVAFYTEKMVYTIPTLVICTLFLRDVLVFMTDNEATKGRKAKRETNKTDIDDIGKDDYTGNISV